MRLAALAGGIVTALVLPVAAHASTTKLVYMGEPPKTTNTFERTYNTDVQDYFPHSSTIHVGDSLKFQSTGFHTLDLPARGQHILSFVLPSGPTPSGVNDQAGQPFWFNGQVKELGFNPLLGKVTKKATYDGTKRVESGVFEGNGAPPPLVVKFTKPGTYTFHCDLHPGMIGKVRVVAANKTVPTAKQDAKAVQRQVASDLATAKTVAHTVAPAGTVLVGAGGKGHVEYYGYFGPSAPISVGTTLKFQIGKGALEQHTATTDSGASSAPPPAPGPGSDQIPDVYLAGLASTFQGAGPFNPIATFSSDQSGGTPASLTSSSHGNGFWNSGVMAANVSPLPSNNSVRFDAPGTYTFYCLIHNFMHITIKVQ